jgi:hypothetical protein
MLSLNFSSQCGHKASKSNIGFLSFEILKKKARIYPVGTNALLIRRPAISGTADF